MNRILVLLAMITAAAVALVGATLAPPASAQNLSPGCQALNDPSFDSFYSAELRTLEFAEGEHITMSAEPIGSPPPTAMFLIVDGVVVDAAAFPGTVEYVFPAAGTYTIRWVVVSIFAQWTVTCAGVDPAQAVADLQQQVTDLGLAKGLTTGLNRKLDGALAALDADDTAGACDSLQAFLNQVKAQTGKKLTEEQASELTEAANDIRELIGC